MASAIGESANIEHLATLLDRNREGIYTCVHCGLCLPACPTYRQLGDENDSPRGRVYLMRAVSESRLAIDSVFAEHIDSCLGCRACETVCPSGVPYGELLEAARAELASTRSGGVEQKLLRFVLNRFFTRRALLGVLMWIARTFRESGLAQLAFDSKLLGNRGRLALALLLSSRPALTSNAENRAAGPSVSTSPKVAILRGCVMEGLFSHVNRATERVLRKSGCELVEANGQVCCGALHAHAGELETAKELARKNIDAFRATTCDTIVINSAGCGAAMKEYKHLLADDPEYAARAADLSKKVKDISEFLIGIGAKPSEAIVARRVAYDAPCHLIHAQKIASAPVDLLRSIRGLELTPLIGSETCCGGAGIYNLQQYELSAKIALDKVDNILASGADMVVTGNPGCIMQIGASLLMRGESIKVAHPIELIDSAI